jgi:hypothetical protein
MITAFFGILLGSVAIGYGFKFTRFYFKVKSWNKVKATVLTKTVQLHQRTSTRSRYAVKVEYKYSFDSKEYTNNLVYLLELLGGQVNHMKSSADSIVAKLSDTPNIYVNPANPTQSVIFCKGIALYIFVILMGIFALLYGLLELGNL